MSAPPQQGMETSAGSSVSNALGYAVGEAYLWLGLPCGFCNGGPLITINQGYVGLVTSFGKYKGLLAPGRHSYNFMTDMIKPVSLKTMTLAIPQQSVITVDNLSVGVSAVCYFRVIDACKAVFEVDNHIAAVNQLCQVTIRTVVGENTLADVLGKRSVINARVTQLMSQDTEKWGVQIVSMEMKDVTIPESMRRAMATVAESRQEAEANIIAAKGKRDSGAILAEAADLMKGNKTALQLQWYETLERITQEKSSTIVVPDSILGLLDKK